MKSKIILLVEDNEDDEVLTVRALKKHNSEYRIIVAKDGAEALDFLFHRGSFEHRSVDDDPQLILLDLNLPKVNGMQVLEQIRANAKTKRFPVVILTSSTESEDLGRCYELGASSYIRKPVDFNQFSEAIKTLGAYWLVLNEPPPQEEG